MPDTRQVGIRRIMRQRHRLIQQEFTATPNESCTLADRSPSQFGPINHTDNTFYLAVYAPQRRVPNNSDRLTLANAPKLAKIDNTSEEHRLYRLDNF
jgi:hypothetical protein